MRHYGNACGSVCIHILLSLCLFAGVVDVSAQTTGKTVWQQESKEQPNYLSGRRALVGKGCEVNMLVNTVKVGSWVSGLGNLVDEDLTNMAVFPSAVSVDVGVAPVVSIRDLDNHYQAGTVAGFVVTSGENSLLTLKVIKAYAIQFYCDGEKVGDPVAVTEGQDAGALGLSLITISSDDVTTTLSAKAPYEFDEVCLMPAGGVDLSLISGTRVKYAFVGEAKKYNLVNAPNGCSDGSDGIDAYNRDFGTNLELDVDASDPFNDKDNVIDEDLTNGVNFGAVVVGGGSVSVVAMPEDYETGGDNNEPPFKKGTVFGFHYANATDILNIGAKTMKLCLGKTTGSLGKEKYLWSDAITVSGDVLKLSLTGGDSGNIEICATEDCYGVKLEEVKIGVGGMKVQYAYIRTPDAVTHRCDMRLSADAHICDSETSYKVTKSDNIDVTFAIISQPGGAGASIDSEGNITGMTANGDYVVTATVKADCQCTDTVTIHRGMDDIETSVYDKPLYNISGEKTYALSTDKHGISGALINIDNLSDPDNILNAQTGDYAQYTGGLALAQNVMIVGVKTEDGSAVRDNLPGKSLKRVGFMIETRSSGLGLDALQFFCIRGFKNGTEVFNKPVEESNAVSLDLIGSTKAEKMRYSVIVPDEYADIDEFQLWKEGVLSLDISKLNIFYAFAAEEDNATAPLAGVDVVSTATGATLNLDRTNAVGVLNVANVTYGLANLIDDDPGLETPLTLAKTVAAGGSLYSVNLGHTYRKGTQVGFVIDNNTNLASVSLGKWLKMVTYLNGEEQEIQQDWDVLGVSVIGAGDKRLVIMETEKDFDEVSIEFSNVLDALDFINIYGVFVREDTDGDGVPDVLDEESCSESLILNEEVTDMLSKGRNYESARMLLHRTFNRGSEIGDNLWSSIVLPVNLTGLQVRNAFGNDTRLAEVEGMDGDLLVFRKIDIPDNDDNAVIEAGKFYIIETVREPDYKKTGGDGWDTFDDGTGYTTGDVYYITGVDYDTANENEPTAEYSNADGTHSVKFCGTYHYNQKLPEDIYAFSGGKLWNITNSAKLKGFRFWIEETFGNSGAKQMAFMVKDGGTTYIQGVEADGTDKSGMVYDLSGRCMGKADVLFSLPCGVYVVNGKKVLVK